MLIVDDNRRFSALQVLNHSWIKVLFLPCHKKVLVVHCGEEQ